ncbi:hypothetical protein [Alishewanella longhuensis]
MIKQHEGRVSIHTSPTGGTRFRVKFSVTDLEFL